MNLNRLGYPQVDSWRVPHDDKRADPYLEQLSILLAENDLVIKKIPDVMSKIMLFDLIRDQTLSSKPSLMLSTSHHS